MADARQKSRKILHYIKLFLIFVSKWHYMTNLDLAKLTTGAKGIAGIFGAQLAQTLPPSSADQTSEIVKIVVQIAIAVATLIGIFKKKKSA